MPGKEHFGLSGALGHLNQNVIYGGGPWTTWYQFDLREISFLEFCESPMSPSRE